MLPLYDASTARQLTTHNRNIINEIHLLALYVFDAASNNELKVEITDTSEIVINGTIITGTPMSLDPNYSNVLTLNKTESIEYVGIDTVKTYFKNYGYSIDTTISATNTLMWIISW